MLTPATLDFRLKMQPFAMPDAINTLMIHNPIESAYNLTDPSVTIFAMSFLLHLFFDLVDELPVFFRLPQAIPLGTAILVQCLADLTLAIAQLLTDMTNCLSARSRA
jgi:hypothetical protein